MEINYLTVISAAVAAFVIGFLWYTVIFSKPWQKIIGMKNGSEYVKTPNLAKFLIITFLLDIIMALNLSAFIGRDVSWSFGLAAGLAAGFGWVALAMAVNDMFEGRSFKLWLINAGFNTVVFATMGLIIGAM